MIRRVNPCLRFQLAFAFLSLADLALTVFLVARPHGRFYEANPIAGWCFRHHGELGLAEFKALNVLLVLSLVLVISRYRPHTAKRILTIGSGFLIVTVTYSVLLYCTFFPKPGTTPEDNPELQCKQSREEIDRIHAPFRATLHRCAIEVVAGEQSLHSAAHTLASTERAQDPKYIAMLKNTISPEASVEECMSAIILIHAIGLYTEMTEELFEVITKLKAEYHETYQRDLKRCPAVKVKRSSLPRSMAIIER